jgi:hypothetical protein
MVTAPAPHKTSAWPWGAPVLITESAEQFADLHGQLEQEIEPRGMVERMFVSDIATLTWEILRHQRCKTAIINMEFIEALKILLLRLMSEHDRMPAHKQIHDLATRWFTHKDARDEILELLKQFGLDEVAIEAEAIRKSSADLETIDRMLTMAEARRNRILRSVAEYREDLAKRLKHRSDFLIEQNDLVRLEHRSQGGGNGN